MRQQAFQWLLNSLRVVTMRMLRKALTELRAAANATLLTALGTDLCELQRVAPEIKMPDPPRSGDKNRLGVRRGPV